MNRYALLQLRLDQTISRSALEEASLAIPSVTRADCALLQRELFGIVVSNLPHPEAVALQAALRARSFPTEIVAQSELPELGPAKRETALRIAPTGLAVVDLYGRERWLPAEEIVFAAAGYLTRLRQRVAGQHQEVVSHGRYGKSVKTVTDYRLQDVPEFRLELFVQREPPRLQWVLDPDNTVLLNGTPVTLRNPDRLNEVLHWLVARQAPARFNQGVRRLGVGNYFVYPSVRAFEEETIWSFYRLLHPAAGA